MVQDGRTFLVRNPYIPVKVMTLTGKAETVREAAAWVRSIHDEYAGALFVFAYRAVGSREAAEDVVQETFVRAWKAADSFDAERGAVSTWLFAIARNVIIDLRRRQQARPREVAPVDSDRGPAVADASALDRALEAWQVADALQRLTPQHREVILEAYYRDRSVAETAERLQVPPGTVKSRLYYGLRNLRLALEEMGVVG
jgi:RNA polymerase sigma-70 factor, ECF subfamily